MFFPFQPRFLLPAYLFAFSSLQVLAQDQQQPTPVVETKVDSVKDLPDYMLLGEFKGTVKKEDGSEETFAVQVRPVGRDRFEAIGHFGALPGEDGFKNESVKMVGQRHKEFVVLSGSPWAIFATQEQCSILDMSGTKVGSLERVTRQSPTLGAKPPTDGFVIFDGTNTDQLLNGQMNEDGLLIRGTEFKQLFQDFDLHAEFWLPFMPSATGQQRGNSGIYLLSRYECQILDSFAQDLLFDGCGAIYRYKSPDLNMCLPPLTWQTYDLRFTSPRWASDGSKLRDARVSIWLNGVKVQDNVALPDKTGHGAAEQVLLLPTKLQDHQDPVLFRNVWVIDRGISGTLEFPIMASQAQEPESVEAAATTATEPVETQVVPTSPEASTN